MFWFSVLKLLSETFLNPRRISKILSWKYVVGDDFKLTLTFSTYFRKAPSIKYHDNPFSSSRVPPREQTDKQMDKHTLRYDEADSRYS